MSAILYCDASALVKRYLAEPEAQILAAALQGASCASARLTQIEVTSAISRRCREGAFDARVRDVALSEVRRDFQGILIVELTSEIATRAEDLLKLLALRASDAVQLASCLELEQRLGVPVPMLVWDRRLATAARTMGVSTLPAGGVY